MRQLFNFQQGRSNFGAWRSYLQAADKDEKDKEVKRLITRLIGILGRLFDLLYQYKPSSDPFDAKYSILSVLQRDDMGIEDIRKASTSYLEILRKLVENIGGIVGSMRYMIE